MKTEYIVISVIGVLAGIGIIYELTKPKNTTTSTTSKSKTTNTTSNKPEIRCETTSITISKGLLGNDYSPSSITITGQYFTPLGTYIIYGENGNNLYEGNISSNGTFNQIIDVSEFNPVAGHYDIQAQDVSTNLMSNIISINVISNTSKSTNSNVNGNGGTNTTGNLLSNEWNHNSVLGSNTNPIPLSTWATSSGVVWLGEGFYQISSTTENYFGSKSQLESEYNTLYPKGQEGTASNPYPLTSWKGAGNYAINSTTSVYLSNENEYYDYVQYGITTTPFDFNKGYQGSGYYLFTSTQFSKLLIEPNADVSKNPTFISNQNQYNSINGYLTKSLSFSVEPQETSDNTYIFTDGYHGEGYYKLTNAEYSKLILEPNADVSTNPVYLTSGEQYYNLVVALNKTAPSNNTTSSNQPPSNNSSNNYNGTLSLNKNSMLLENGQSITITGTGFKPNTMINIVGAQTKTEAENSAGIGLNYFETDSSGSFTKTDVYNYNINNNNGISSLGNAFNQNGKLNILYIVAYDYAGNRSNIVELQGN